MKKRQEAIHLKELPGVSSIALDPAEKALFQQLESDMQQIQQQANGLLAVILRKNKAQGNWKLAGDKLVRL